MAAVWSSTSFRAFCPPLICLISPCHDWQPFFVKKIFWRMSITKQLMGIGFHIIIFQYMKVNGVHQLFDYPHCSKYILLCLAEERTWNKLRVSKLSIFIFEWATPLMTQTTAGIFGWCHFTFTFRHLADTFIQSDLQLRTKAL